MTKKPRDKTLKILYTISKNNNQKLNAIQRRR